MVRILWIWVPYVQVHCCHAHVLIIAGLPSLSKDLPTYPLLEYVDTFLIRKHGGTSKFERSIYVMLFPAYSPDEPSLIKAATVS